ncbi:MAG TPA: proton-conducting transporter membrane subunit [Tepidisphaeraceae bacterium]|nr:proton-conducting transporter membrane subunit [Tepidisphaeraceae bacterium]
MFWFFSALMLAAAAALLAGWGGSGRRRAAVRMLIVLGIGLVLLAVVIVGEFLAARRALGIGSIDLVRLAGPELRRLFMMASWSSAGRAFFVCAVIAFAMRLPVLPFQGWFSGILAQAPTPVAMVLAGVIPITGGYGLLRIAGPLFPAAATSLWSVCAILAMVSIVYCALCAAAQTETSRSIGYAISSFSSFALLGAASRTSTGAEGVVLIMLSTGLIASLLILGGRYADPKSSLVSFALILVLVAPGLLSQMMVLMGVFLAARSDSLLRTSGAASAATLYVTAAATCLGILLTGVWATRLLNAFFASPDLVAPSSTEPDRGHVGTAAALAVLAILLGILPTPLCLIFSHSAIRVLLHG